jgi:hypothetical protein
MTVYGLPEVRNGAEGAAFVSDTFVIVARNYDGRNTEATARKFIQQLQTGHDRHVDIRDQTTGRSERQRFKEVSA